MNHHVQLSLKIVLERPAHSCNPSYSGGSWFEANSREIVPETLKKTHNKKGLTEWLKW
jgi:hypothetical protein